MNSANHLTSGHHHLHPFTFQTDGGKYAHLSLAEQRFTIIVGAAVTTGIAVIATIAVSTIFSPLLLVGSVALGYIAFTFIAARFKAVNQDRISAIKTANENIALKQKQRVAAQEELKNKQAKEVKELEKKRNEEISEIITDVRELDKTLQIQIDVILNIDNDTQAEEYLKKFKMHYDTIYEIIQQIRPLLKKIPSSSAYSYECRIDGVRELLSVLYLKQERAENMKSKPWDYTDTSFSHMGSAFLFARKQLTFEEKLPHLIKFAMEEEMEALKQNWQRADNTWMPRYQKEVPIKQLNIEKSNTTIVMIPRNKT